MSDREGVANALSPGGWLRSTREALVEAKGSLYSLRQVAGRLGVEPSYLSKIERDLERSPSETLLLNLAKELEVNEIVLLARFGRISADVKEIILNKPEEFTQLIRVLSSAPEGAVFQLIRKVNDGNW